jgi:hypothetical protein
MTDSVNDLEPIFTSGGDSSARSAGAMLVATIAIQMALAETAGPFEFRGFSING